MDPVSKAQADGANTAPNKPSRTRGLCPRWKKGQSGNPSGRPKKKPITEIYEKLLAKEANTKVIAETVMGLIKAKRMASILTLREMAERVEGKVTQPVELSGDLTLLTDEELQARWEKAEAKK